MTTTPTDSPTTSRIARVPWNPVVGVIFLVLVFFLSQGFAEIPLSIYVSLKHWSTAAANDWLSNSVPAQFAFILLVEVLCIGAIYLFVRKFYNKPLSLIGLKRPTWMDPLYGLAMVVPYFVLYGLTVGVASYLLPSLNVEQHQDIGFTSVHGTGPLVLTFISLVVLPPLAEEIMVRGFLYSTLKKSMKTIWAVLLTSALFAIAHLGEGGSGGLLWIGALDTFVLSLALIYLREKTGSLWASITLHAIKNGIAYVSLFLAHSR